jgi:exodeoxyribonuclease VII small subunit
MRGSDQTYSLHCAHYSHVLLKKRRLTATHPLGKVHLSSAIVSYAVPKKEPKAPTFEEALNELESLVETLEQGDLSLEDSLKSFERGVSLTRSCQQALKAAEQKIQILSDQRIDAEPEPFERDD